MSYNIDVDTDTNNERDDVDDIIKEFGIYEDHWSETRTMMSEDLKFARLGEQWDEKIKEIRIREARPMLTINKCPSFARQVVNDARLNKPAIKVHPADDHADPETAKVMNGLIRNIEYTSNAEVAYDTALECAVYSGMGFYRISIDHASYDQFEKDIIIERMNNPLAVLGDITSEACDASDWNRAYVIDVLLRDEFKKRFPNANAVEFKSGNTIDDNWRTEEDVRIVERWLREEKKTNLLKLSDGTILLEEAYLKHREQVFDPLGLGVTGERETITFDVSQQIVTGEEIISTTEWPGRYIPIVPVYGEEFNIEGKRHFHSMFFHSKDSQRMFNYWRTASTELVALQPKVPYIGAVGQFDTDGDKWASANTDAHPYLEYDEVGQAPPPKREQPPTISQGALQETMSADMDMKSIIGINDPNLGVNFQHDMSGKAVHEWKAGGDISNFHFVDNFSRSMRYAGRVLIDIIPHVFSEPRIQRIMGHDGEVENVPLQQMYEAKGKSQIHDFSKGKYDLTVETGPSFTTKRTEALESMQEMVKAAPELMNVVGDLIAKNMDWDGADEISERLKAMLPPQIRALESMEGIPEEARAIVAQCQEQLQQKDQELQQQSMLMGELQQNIKLLELNLTNKEGELNIKQNQLITENKKLLSEENIKTGELLLKRQKTAVDSEIEMYKAKLEGAVEIEVARIKAGETEGSNIVEIRMMTSDLQNALKDSKDLEQLIDGLRTPSGTITQ